MLHQFSRCHALNIIVILNLFMAVCHSQTLTFRPKSPFPLDTRLKFRQELNIYEWAYALDFKKALNNRFSVDINEAFRSTLQTIQSRDLWKDNQTLYMGFKYDFSSRLALEPYFRSSVLNDELSGFDNDIRFHSGNLKLGYQVTQNLRVSPEIAGKWQTQMQRSDQGFGFALTADLMGLNVEGYRNDLTFYGMRDTFPERRNGDLNLEYTVQKQFYEATADTLTIVFERLRRDSYDSDINGLFVRNLVQSRRGFRNALSYRIASNTTFFIHVRLFPSDAVETFLKNIIFSG